jgi:phospholipase/carboxylesterase
LQALGADVTLDRFPGLGHGIDARVLSAIVRRLGE